MKKTKNQLVKRRNRLIQKLQKVTVGLQTAVDECRAVDILSLLDEREILYQEITETQSDISKSAGKNEADPNENLSLLDIDAVEMLKRVSVMEPQIKESLKKGLSKIEVELASLRKGKNTLKAYKSNRESDVSVSSRG